VEQLRGEGARLQAELAEGREVHRQEVAGVRQAAEAAAASAKQQLVRAPA
jgi:hypothetical protein